MNEVMATWPRCSCFHPRFPFTPSRNSTNHGQPQTDRGNSLPKMGKEARWPLAVGRLRTTVRQATYTSGISYRLAGIYTDAHMENRRGILSTNSDAQKLLRLTDNTTQSPWQCFKSSSNFLLQLRGTTPQRPSKKRPPAPAEGRVKSSHELR